MSNSVPLTNGCKEMPVKKFTAGYVLVPGFRSADVIGIQAVLGPHPLDRSIYVAPASEPVAGKSNMTLVPNATFDDCPELDVLVIGDIPDSALENERLVSFLRERIPAARHVIGVSAGVEALARTGLMAECLATADRAHLDRLGEHGISPRSERQPVVNGKFVTAGPSTGMIEAAYLVQGQLRGETFARYLELNLEYDPVALFASPPATEPAPPPVSGQEGLKVAAILPDRVYIPDIMGTLDVLGLLPGTETFLVSDNLGPSRCLLGPTVLPNCTYDECPDVDVLVVGATHPRHLSDTKLLNFIRRQDKATKAMISVCAGSLVFGAAGLLDGKRATSNFHHTNLLRRFGAMPSHKAVERDRKYFSAGPAIGSYEIALQVVSELYGDQAAHELEQDVLEYAPNPVHGVGSPEKAGKLLSLLSKALFSPSLPVFLIAGKIGRRRLERNKTSRATGDRPTA